MERYLLGCAMTSLIGLGAQAQMNDYDAAILEFTGLEFVCSEPFTPVVKIQNIGSVIMNSCVVETWKNGLFVNSFDWQLAVAAAPGQVRQPVLPTIPNVSIGDAIEIRIISVNDIPDEGPDNNVLPVVVDMMAATATTYMVRLTVDTYDMPTQLSWSITNELAQVVAAGGPFAMANVTEEAWVELDPNGCYMVRFEQLDGQPFTEAVLRLFSDEQELISLGDAATSSVVRAGFVTGLTLGAAQPVRSNEIMVMPNPTDGLLRVDLGSMASEAVVLELFDAAGRAVLQERHASAAGNSMVLDLSAFASGAYALVIRSSEGVVSHTRVLVQR